MGYRDDSDSDVQRLLNELCVNLGFCLPPADQHRLCQTPPRDVDSFTDAVFAAEGLGDMRDLHDANLRRQVRQVVDKHFRQVISESMVCDDVV